MIQQPYWTKVSVSDNCIPEIPLRCKEDKGHKAQKVITDKICGRIRQKCNSRSKIIWKGIGLKASGSIKVINTSDCIMELEIKMGKKHRTSIVPILPKDEITLTISLIECIAVRCCGTEEKDVCSGCFTLIIHYPCSSSEKDDDCSCC